MSEIRSDEYQFPRPSSSFYTLRYPLEFKTLVPPPCGRFEVKLTIASAESSKIELATTVLKHSTTLVTGATSYTRTDTPVLERLRAVKYDAK